MIKDDSNAEPKVMGVAFLGIFKFIKSLPDGDHLFNQVKESLPPEAAKACSGKIMAVVQYPYITFITFAQFLQTVDKVVGFGDLSLSLYLGGYTADLDYDFFFGSKKTQLTPEDLFRDCNIYWQSYYPNSGQMKSESSDPDNAIIRIYDFPSMDPAHCRLMEGWMARSMERAGVEWIQFSETRCTSKGHEFHEFQGSWKMRGATVEVPHFIIMSDRLKKKLEKTR